MEHLLIALFPILGCLYKFFSKEYLLVIIGVSFALLCPVWFSPYYYAITWLDDLLILFFLSGIWGIIVAASDNKRKMYTVSAYLVLVLGFVLLYLAFVNAFTGSNTILKHWEKEDYQVNYIKSSGFSGQPLYYYELQKENCYGLFKAALDKENEDTLCDVELFDKIDYRFVHFDKCKETIQVPQ